MTTISKFTATIALLVTAAGFTARAQEQGQRRITPVTPSTNTVKAPPKGIDDKVVERYLAGDTLSALAEARADSLKHVYPRYPLLTDVTFGINFLDPVLVLFGQKYGGVDLSATLNLWNRLQPVVEIGAGMAKDTPDDMNYTYRGKLSPYARLGVNYNLRFKSEPRYMVVAGARLGASAFTYDVTGVTVSDGYWNESEKFDLKGMKSHALWAEVLLGLRVQLWHRLSMGWQVKWHKMLSYKHNGYSAPWYVPGYGNRERSLTASFSLYYTLPLSKSKWPKTDKPTLASAVAQPQQQQP